jgi:hypothetical protein
METMQANARALAEEHNFDEFDIAQAVATLSEKGGLHEADRRRVKTGVGY